MDLEAIMLSEISQRQIQYELTYMWNLKTTHMTQHNTIKTDSQIQRTKVVFRGEKDGQMSEIIEGD